MHIKDNLINFLYDKDYFISLYENSIYVFNYTELIALKDNIAIININNIRINIKGDTFRVKKMSKKEILITGLIKEVGITYE